MTLVQKFFMFLGQTLEGNGLDAQTLVDTFAETNNLSAPERRNLIDSLRELNWEVELGSSHGVTTRVVTDKKPQQ